jgi:TonB family protein
MIENRRHLRHVVSPRLYVSMSGTGAGGILHDVSDGGLSLELVGPDEVEEQFVVNFELSETGEQFEGMGKVVWKSAAGNRIGLQFVDLPEAYRYRVRDWLSSKARSHGTRQNAVVLEGGDTPVWGYPLGAGDLAEPRGLAVLETPELEKRAASEARSKASTRLGVTPNASRDVTSNVNRDVNSDVTSGKTAVAQETVIIGRDYFAGRRFETNNLRGKAVELQRKIVSWLRIRLRKDSWPWLHIVVVGILAAVSATVGIRLLASQGVSAGMEGRSLVAKLLNPSSSKGGLRRTSTSLVVRYEGPRPSSDSSSSPQIPGSVIKLFSAPLSGKKAERHDVVAEDSSGEIPFEQNLPEYPIAAVRANIEGKVVVQAVIATNGVVKDARVVSGPAMLGDAALEAVKTWRYLPHYQNSKLVEVESLIELEFVLNPQQK